MDYKAQVASLRARIAAVRKMIDTGEPYNGPVVELEEQQKIVEKPKITVDKKAEMDDIKAKLLGKK